jgi:hypothetical protein
MLSVSLLFRYASLVSSESMLVITIIFCTPLTGCVVLCLLQADSFFSGLCFPSDIGGSANE